MDIGHDVAESIIKSLQWSLMLIFCHQPKEAAFAQQWDSNAAVGTKVAAVAAVAGHQQQLQ